MYGRRTRARVICTQSALFETTNIYQAPAAAAAGDHTMPDRHTHTRALARVRACVRA